MPQQSAKRYIENDLLTVGKLVELNRYIDYIILDRIYRCSFYSSFGYEKIKLDLNDEVDAVTAKILAKKGPLFPVIKEVINSVEADQQIAREMVAKRYTVLAKEEYIDMDSNNFSEYELIRGTDVDRYIKAFNLNTDTENYVDRLFTHFDFMEKHEKRMDEAGKAISGLMGNIGFSSGSGTDFPDPTKMFGVLFGGDKDDNDPLEKEK